MWRKTASGRNYDMTEVTIDVLPGSAFELALRVLRTAVKEGGRSVHVVIDEIGYFVQPYDLSGRFYIEEALDRRPAATDKNSVRCNGCGSVNHLPHPATMRTLEKFQQAFKDRHACCHAKGEPVRCATCGRETVWCDMCGEQQMTEENEERR